MIRVSVEEADELQVVRSALISHGLSVDAVTQADDTLTLHARASEQGAQSIAASGDELYRKIFDYAADGIVIADGQSTYLDANPAMCRMLGYSREEMIGLHASDIVASHEIEHIAPAIHAVKSTGDYSRLWSLKRKDGSTFPAEVTATTLPDGNIMGVIRDVSARIESDKRIRDLNRTYSVLSDVNQLIVRDRDTQSIIERACRIAVDGGGFLLAWIGLRRGKAQLELAASAGTDADTLRIIEAILREPEPGCAFTAQALATGKASICRDIETDPLSVSWRAAALERGYRSMASFPLVIDGNCAGTFNLYADQADFFNADEVRLLDELAGDISFAMTMAQRERERRELERQLTQAQKMQAIGTLAGGIAHDFNNILMAIAGNTELARSEASNTPGTGIYLDEIDRAAKRASELVKRILAFSRPSEQKLRPISLTPVFEEAVNLIRATVSPSVELHLRANEHLPAVRADESQIHQVAVNLLTNAWHALQNKRGRIDIELAACRVDSTLTQRCPDLVPGPYVRVSVADNGIGMSEATLQRLFEPFFTTKPPGEGTGLGLPVVHGIVSAHHGGIVVDSSIDRGSVFHVYLPVCDEQPSRERQEPQLGPAARGHGERILYIDDEESLVFLTGRVLERLGYCVTCYTNPTAALRAFHADPNSFDAIITDHNMPAMTGLDVAAAVLQIRPAMPLLLMSGYMRPQELEAARRLGVRHIVLKPDSIGQFGSILQRMLAEQGIGVHAV